MLSERIFIYASCSFIMFSANIKVLHVHGMDSHACNVIRNGRDYIQSNNCKSQNVSEYCQLLGAYVHRASVCLCVCPFYKQTFMENTGQCTRKNDVWPGCNVGLKAPGEIPVLQFKSSASRLVALPSKFRRCRVSIDKQKSFYLTSDGWKNITSNLDFPFEITYRRNNTPLLVWSRLFSVYRSRLIRLGITGCKSRQTDCLLFKVVGLVKYPNCMVNPTTQPSITTASSTKVLWVSSTTDNIPSNVVPDTSMEANITTPTHKPSVVDKGKQGSPQEGTPWVITGAIMGVVAVLVVCIIVLVLWFCLWKKKLKRKYEHDNSTTSSAFILNPSQSSSGEVTYAAPHHPYQDLKPPVRGAPPGVYQSLSSKPKEDAAGYLLPVTPQEQTTTHPHNEPIYNEIGSPRYDYALPEDTVRFSIHSLNQLANNGPAYVGRPSKDQEEPNASVDASRVYAAPIQTSPQDGRGQLEPNLSGAPVREFAAPIQNRPTGTQGVPEYLDLHSEENMPLGRHARANTYQDPIQQGLRDTQQSGPSSRGQGGPSGNGPYQALLSSSTSNARYEPLRLSRGHLNEGNSSLV